MSALKSSTGLTVLSFNILAEQFIDYSDLSADYPGIKINDLKEENRLPKTITFLKKINADIMMLQEINAKTLKLIREEFDTYVIYPLARHQTEEAKQKGNMYGNLIMIKKGIASKGSYQTYTVPVLGSAFAILNTKINDKNVLLVNIHLDADPTETKRKLEIEVLLALLKPHLNTHSILISGDFNTSNANTHKKFKDFTSVIDKHKGTYLNDDPMIDWIYVRNITINSGKIFKPAKASASTPLKKYGSDHYPVMGNIII